MSERTVTLPTYDEGAPAGVEPYDTTVQIEDGQMLIVGLQTQGDPETVHGQLFFGPSPDEPGAVRVEMLTRYVDQHTPPPPDTGFEWCQIRSLEADLGTGDGDPNGLLLAATLARNAFYLYNNTVPLALRRDLGTICLLPTAEDAPMELKIQMPTKHSLWLPNLEVVYMLARRPT